MADYLTNFRFLVMLGPAKYGFTKVSNLAQELEYESIPEGGRNSTPLLFRKPKSKMDTMVLERGMEMNDAVARRFSVGAKVEDLILYLGPGKDMPYTFDRGVVTKVEIDPLDAMDNRVLIRKVEIAHTGLYLVRTKR